MKWIISNKPKIHLGVQNFLEINSLGQEFSIKTYSTGPNNSTWIKQFQIFPLLTVSGTQSTHRTRVPNIDTFFPGLPFLVLVYLYSLDSRGVEKNYFCSDLIKCNEVNKWNASAQKLKLRLTGVHLASNLCLSCVLLSSHVTIEAPARPLMSRQIVSWAERQGGSRCH